MRIRLQLLLFHLVISFVTLAQSNGPKGVTLDSVNFYKSKGNFAKATEFAEKWRDKVLKQKGETWEEYGSALNILGNVLNSSRKTQGTETRPPGSTGNLQIGSGRRSSGGCKIYNNLGILYWNTGSYPQSESSYLKSLEIGRKSTWR